jgi:peptidyl-prolyl cis-trans isomerase C
MTKTTRVFLAGIVACAALMGCSDGADKAQPVTPVAAPSADAGQAKPAEKAEKAAEKKEEVRTGPVATVNGVKITRETYNGELDSLKKRFSMFGGNLPEAQMAKFKQRIIERLVEEELIRQKLDTEKVEIPEAAIQKELDDYKGRVPGGAERFEEFLKKTGKTIDDLKVDIKKRLALKTFLNKDKALEVTDEACQKYFDENKKRFATKERCKAAHILVKTGKDDDKAKNDEVKKKIDAIYKEANKKGTDFAALAKAKSEGPSAPRGGDLGWFTRGRMVKEFETAAFSMKPGDVSKPIKTKFGWHVLKLYEREEAGEKKFPEVKEDIVKRLEARKFREARTKFLKDLRDNGKVEVLEKIVIPPPSPASRPAGIPGKPQPMKINPTKLKPTKVTPTKVTPTKVTPKAPAK